MPVVKLNKATHIYAEVGTHNVSQAECDRLCALGIAEPCVVIEVDAKKVEEAKAKKAKKKADK